ARLAVETPEAPWSNLNRSERNFQLPRSHHGRRQPRRDAERLLLGSLRPWGLTRIEQLSSGGHDLYLPDASADQASRPRFLPYLWHGARARSGFRRSGAEPRARRYDSAVLGRALGHASVPHARNGRPPHEPPHAARPDVVELAAIPIRHAGGAVGGLAVLHARLAIARHLQSEHVYAY